jgi:hypothetical protein
MSLDEKSIEQLRHMYENLLLSLKKLNPNATPDTSILAEGAHILGEEFELKHQINYMIQKIFHEYRERVNLEKPSNIDKSVEYMNEYITTQVVPFIPGISTKSDFKLFGPPEYTKKAFVELSPSEYLQKWNADYKSWKKSKEKDSSKHFDLDLQFSNFYAVLIRSLKIGY